MNRDGAPQSSQAVWGAFAISVLVHLVILLGFLPPQFTDFADEEAQETEEFRVETIVEPKDEEREEDEPDDPEELAEPDDERPEPEEQQETVEKDEEEQQEEEKLEKIDIDRKVVTQETNDDSPEEADYLSQRANKTEEETRARETTTKEVDPGEPKEDVEQPSVARGDPSEAPGAQDEETEIARRSPTPKPRPEPEPEPRPTVEPRERSERQKPEAEDGVQKMEETPEQSPMVKEEKPSPEELFKPKVEDYDKVFSETDEKHRERVKEERSNRGRSILGDWREREKVVKAALENHISEVKPGNHTSVNAKKASYAQYINQIHRKIHARWGASFLPMLDTQYPRGHPLNDPSLNTQLEFVIQSPSGTIEAINIVQSSGELMYDAEALSISYTVGPHPNPPAEVVSPDGKVYVHWNFWRDTRQCGPFGASIYIVDNQRDRGG
ncbi:MAG: energy transducer TonB family protein [Myxococcota bacterium]